METEEEICERGEVGDERRKGRGNGGQDVIEKTTFKKLKIIKNNTSRDLRRGDLYFHKYILTIVSGRSTMAK